MRPFCNANVSLRGTNVEAHASHVILHVLHLTTKPYSSQNRETVHIDPSRYLPFKPLLPCDLAHMHCDVRGGIGTQVMRVVDYAHFSLNMFESLSITLKLIQCFAFDHIQPCFLHIFHQAQSLHEFLSQPQCALSIATFIGKVLEHQESLPTFTLNT